MQHHSAAIETPMVSYMHCSPWPTFHQQHTSTATEWKFCTCFCFACYNSSYTHLNCNSIVEEHPLYFASLLQTKLTKFQSLNQPLVPFVHNLNRQQSTSWISWKNPLLTRNPSNPLHHSNLQLSCHLELTNTMDKQPLNSPAASSLYTCWNCVGNVDQMVVEFDLAFKIQIESRRNVAYEWSEISHEVLEISSDGMEQSQPEDPCTRHQELVGGLAGPTSPPNECRNSLPN